MGNNNKQTLQHKSCLYRGVFPNPCITLQAHSMPYTVQEPNIL